MKYIIIAILTLFFALCPRQPDATSEVQKLQVISYKQFYQGENTDEKSKKEVYDVHPFETVFVGGLSDLEIQIQECTDKYITFTVNSNNMRADGEHITENNTFLVSTEDVLTLYDTGLCDAESWYEFSLLEN